MRGSKTTSLAFSADDLEQFARAMSNAPDDAGETAIEIAERLGISIDLVRRRLRRAQRAGRLIVGRALRERIDGQPCPVPVYRLRQTN